MNRTLQYILLATIFPSISVGAISVKNRVQGTQNINKELARKKLQDMRAEFTGDAFLRSVIDGESEKVRLFLAAGMNPNVRFEGNEQIGNRVIGAGDTALIIALGLKHLDMIPMLLSNGADVNQAGHYKVFPLLVADVSFAKLLVDKGADVNKSGHYGTTALMSAAWKGDVEKIHFLLDSGADIDAKNDGGKTALYTAIVQGQREAVRTLLARGADLSDFSERAIKALTSEPDERDELTQLIRRLYPKRTENNTTGPSLEDQKDVPERLFAIANESAESRAKVIERLMDVVEDPEAKEEMVVATAWMAAVRLLGRLRATEAIDLLVRNLDRTGQNGVRMSIHIRPVYSALVQIGEPAVPRLIEALSGAKTAIRAEAAWALKAIQGQVAKGALESAYLNEKDEAIKTEIKRVLEWIEMESNYTRNDN